MSSDRTGVLGSMATTKPINRQSYALGGRFSGISVTPIMLLVGTLIAIAFIEPAALSYDGLSLILIGTMPIVLATMAQLFIMTAGDIDLGIGQFIGLINVLIATTLVAQPSLAVLWIVCSMAAYIAMGTLVEIRKVPSIVVTFGMGSIWLGISLLVLPTPGGESPIWLLQLVNAAPAYVPLPVLVFVVAALVVHILLFSTRLGIRLRAVGAAPEASTRVGISVVRTKMILYALAAVMAVVTGLVLTGTTGSGDANAASTMVLSTVAAVIVGGGEFRGGRINPIGAVCAAVAIGLITSIMAFLNVSAAYTSAVEGLILICALGLRVGSRWIGRRGSETRRA